jgi:hypothetical protein
MIGRAPGARALDNDGHDVQRVRSHDVERVAERLSERDWGIIEIVNRLRVVRGDQLERLFFSQLDGRSRAVSRGRVLRRLVTWQVVDQLPRRIGGSPRGSSGSMFALGLIGQRLLAQRQAMAGVSVRVRHAGVPTDRTLRHTVAVSELCVSLVEHAWSTGFHVAGFEAEPACWWRDGLAGYLKPDAYVLLVQGRVRDHWWVEVDLATESLPTLKRKFLAYLSFVERGQLGPDDVIPRVLLIVPSEQRYESVRLLLNRLPEPADTLFGVVTERRAVDYIVKVLRE